MLFILNTMPAGSEEKPAPPDEGDCGELVARAREGDEEAFEKLVGLFERFVYNTAYRTLSSFGMPPDAAEDIAQSSFIKVWRTLPGFRGDCALSTWIYKITVNTARDYIRHTNRHKVMSLTEGEDGDESEYDVPVTSGDTVPEDALEKKEMIIAVREAIESLPEDQRRIVIMRDIHGLPYQAIADALGLELGTVKSRLNRGRINLKTILKKRNFL